MPPQSPNPSEVLNDPKFRILKPDDQVRVLGLIDPDFQHLSQEEQRKVVTLNMQRFQPSLAERKAEEPKSFWTTKAGEATGNVVEFLDKPLLSPTTVRAGVLATSAGMSEVAPLLERKMGLNWMADLTEDMRQVGTEVLSGVTSPINLGLLLSMAFTGGSTAAIAVSRAAGGTFTILQAMDSFKQVRGAIALYRQGKRREGRKMLMGGGVSALLAALSGKATVSSPGALSTTARRSGWRSYYESEGMPVEQAQRAAELQAARTKETPPTRLTPEAAKRAAPGVPAVAAPHQEPPTKPKKLKLKKLTKMQRIQKGVAETVPESAARRALLRIPRMLSTAIARPALAQAGYDLVQQRSIDIASRDLDVARFTSELQRTVPAEDLKIEKIGYVLEGAAPKSILSPEGMRALGRIRDFTRQQDAMLREAYGAELPLKDAETYLTHIWDFGDDPHGIRRTMASNRLLRDRFLRKRSIDTYKEGIEDLKLKPRFDSVADILKTRANWATRAMANRRMAKTLKDMGFIMHPTTAAKWGVTWWPKVEAPVLDRAVYIGGKRELKMSMKEPSATGEPSIFTITRTSEVRLQRRPVFVHPDIKQAVEAVFGNPVESPSLKGLDMFRATTKKFILAATFFHHIALSEQGQAIHGGLVGSELLHGNLGGAGREALRTATSFFATNSDYWRGLKEATVEVLGGKPGRPPAFRWNSDLVDDAVQHGLLLQTPDMESQVVTAMRRHTPTRWLGDIGYVWDKALWDYFHQGQMLEAYHSIVDNEMRRLEPSASPEAMKRQVATFVNDAFGAQNFERLLLDPREQMAINYALLAPAWSVSVLRTPLHLLEGGIGRRLASRWAIGSAVAWFTTTQLLNYAFSKYYNMPDQDGQKGGHFTWDNPGVPVRFVGGKYIPGLTANSWNIAAGYNTDGTERYIRFGKALREPFIWMLHPLNTAGSKTSIPARLAVEASDRLVEAYRYPDSGVEQMEKAIDALVETATPLPLKDALDKLTKIIDPKTFRGPAATTQFLSQPATRGISLSRAAAGYRLALDDKRPDIAELVLQAAEANHVPRGSVVNLSRYLNRREQRAGQGPKVRYDVKGVPSYPEP